MVMEIKIKNKKNKIDHNKAFKIKKCKEDTFDMILKEN